MARWRCKNCAAVIDNHNITRPEDTVREIRAEKSSQCPVCDERAGFDNLDYPGIILPFENKTTLN